MPALGRANQRALEVQCQANLHGAWSAAGIHVYDHQGFLPIGGWHWRPIGGIADPHGLADDRSVHYIYYEDNGRQRPVPVTVALAINMKVPVRLDSREHLEADMQGEGIRKLFRCPSQEGQLQGLTQRSSEWIAPRDWSSYVFNEAIMGIREDYTNPNPPMGKLSRIKSPSTVMYMMDGRPRNQDSDNWLMVPDNGSEETLWDFQMIITSPGETRGKDLLDFLRHRYRANVLFLDGHVQSIPMTEEGLSTVGISKGID